MVGTPKLPLKYRRKAGPVPITSTSFRAYTQQLAMARFSPDMPSFGSDDTVPQSPTSSYLSPMSSSPTRYMYTPEPPSSPLTDPFVLSSPRSSNDCPSGPSHFSSFDVHSSKLALNQDTKVDRSGWLSRRRSSSLTAPTLVSDMDQSEYSDVDFSTFSDDAPEPPPFIRTTSRAVVKISDLLGPEDLDPLESLRHRPDTEPEGTIRSTWQGEIDIASALLDLSRQVRISTSSMRSASTSPKDANYSQHGHSLSQTMPDPVKWKKHQPVSNDGDTLICIANDTVREQTQSAHRRHDLGSGSEVVIDDVTPTSNVITSSVIPDREISQTNHTESERIITASAPAMSHVSALPNEMPAPVPSTLLDQDSSLKTVSGDGDGTDYAANVSDLRRTLPADLEDARQGLGSDTKASQDNNNSFSAGSSACFSISTAREDADVDIDNMPSDAESDISSALTSLSSSCSSSNNSKHNPAPTSEIEVLASSDLELQRETELPRVSPSVTTQGTHAAPGCVHDRGIVLPCADRENGSSDVKVGVNEGLEERDGEDLSLRLSSAVQTEVGHGAAPVPSAPHTPSLTEDVQSTTFVTGNVTTSVSSKLPSRNVAHDAGDEDHYPSSLSSSPLTAISSLPETEAEAGPSCTRRSRSRSVCSSRSASRPASRRSASLNERDASLGEFSKQSANHDKSRRRAKDGVKAKIKPRMRMTAKEEKENKGVDGSGIRKKAKEKETQESEARGVSLLSEGVTEMDVESEDGTQAGDRRYSASERRKVKPSKKGLSRKRRKIEDEDETVVPSRASSSIMDVADEFEANEQKANDNGNADKITNPQKRRKRQPRLEIDNPPARAPSVSSVSNSQPSNSTCSNPELRGLLIQTMALSRASSMPASSLIRELLRAQPHMAHERNRSEWLEEIELALCGSDVFGRVEREGLDAADKPLEALYFYIPENDDDQDRAALLQEMMPKKRNETKKYKQYYYRPLGKLTRWEAEDDA